MSRSILSRVLPCMLIGCILLHPTCISAQSKTEAELLRKIVFSLQHEDSLAYASVFPSADTMINVTLRKAPAHTDAYQRSVYLKARPEMIVWQDSLIRQQANALYKAVYERGERLGIHWTDILLNRYELEALAKTRDAALEAIAPERFVGYVFVEDMQTRKVFALMIADIMKMEGKWYGGELNYIFEADTKDIFNAKLKAEKIRIRKGLPDPTEQETDSLASKEEELVNKRKQVSDRKFYTGYLDDEIPVSLYIRYIAGDCPGAICSWEAIFRFGDNEYMRQEVSKNADGKWVFVEEETDGVMELELSGTTYTGIYSATFDKIDYDAELREKTMTKKKMEKLDAIIEKEIAR